MARIAGVDLPKAKRIEIALTYIFGIGRTTAEKITAEAGINPDTRTTDLTADEVNKIKSIIERDHKVEGTLRGEIAMNIKRLMDIGSYRGLRHIRGLPCHGQNTKNNSRTRKGRKMTVGRKKKK